MHTAWQRNNRNNSNKKSKKFGGMEKSLYICNATNLESEGNTYRNTAYCVSSRCTSAPRSRGFVAKLGRVRSLFVNTRKTCSTMLQTNKQATQAKNSNLSRSFHTITTATLVAIALPLLIADADSTAILLLTKIVGVAFLGLAAHLAQKWHITDEDYSNELM
jgi:hypothetical protein